MFTRWICVVFLSIATVISAQDVIRGTYSYTYGDSESLVEARETCRDLALREAIESYSVYVESSTEVENFQVSEDIIQTLAAGYLKDVKIVEQAEEGRTITITVEATVQSDEVEALIAERSMAEEEVDSLDEADDDPESRLFSLLSEYEKRMKSVEETFEQKKYGEALSQMQELQELLEQIHPDESSPVLWTIYQAYVTRSDIVYTLYRVALQEFQNNRVRARVNIRILQEKARELEGYLEQLREISGLTARQKVIQYAVITRCQRVLSWANRKIDQYN
ncbi:hypothetical protein JW824_02925 [bacterium]|nr:hypothetical protein [bacterium]RQV98300.1 MAG: hypothetical protein EH221_02135 [bacterium]